MKNETKIQIQLLWSKCMYIARLHPFGECVFNVFLPHTKTRFVSLLVRACACHLYITSISFFYASVTSSLNCQWIILHLNYFKHKIELSIFSLLIALASVNWNLQFRLKMRYMCWLNHPHAAYIDRAHTLPPCFSLSLSLFLLRVNQTSKSHGMTQTMYCYRKGKVKKSNKYFVQIWSRAKGMKTEESNDFVSFFLLFFGVYL